MHTLSSTCVVATVGQPLFGSQWLALAAVLASVTVFLLVVAALGRWLAATHPQEQQQQQHAAPVAAPAAPRSAEPSGPLFAVIAAAVATTLGSRARVAAIRLMSNDDEQTAAGRLQWSIEGRRQIYSSHQFR